MAYDTVLSRFRIPGVLSAVIADENGLVVDGFGGKDLTREYLAGFGKSIIDTGEELVKRAVSEEKGSEYPCSADMLTIETDEAKVFIKRAKDKTLVVMTEKSFTNIGLMRILLREASKILEKMMVV